MANDVTAKNALLEAVLEEGKNVTIEEGGGLRNIILKVNYNADDIPKGAWVYGQREKQGEIEFAGVAVGERVDVVRSIEGVEKKIALQKNAIIPLVIRQRHNFYNFNTPEENCSSPLFKHTNETIYGNVHGYPCNSDCPYKDKSRGSSRCKLEFVLFGIVPNENEDIPVVLYAKNTSYFSFLEWKKTANTGIFEIDGRQVQKPVRLCSYYLSLGSIPAKNGNIKYYQGYFEKGDMVEDVDKFKKYVAMADELVDVLDRQQKNNGNTSTQAKPALEQNSVIPNKALKIPSQIEDDIPDNADDIEDDIPNEWDTSNMSGNKGSENEIERLKRELAEIKSKKKN